jgi:hypothetical protein
MKRQDDRKGATFSPERAYRYKLWRTWDQSLPTLAFVMLNPSTADEEQLDPTCRRCRNYAQAWDFGKLLVGNIFAVRATDPDNMRSHDNPVGPRNDEALQEITDDADSIVFAWGHHGEHRNRGREVATILGPAWCIDTTEDGHPVHPLYQPKDVRPQRFSGY